MHGADSIGTQLDDLITFSKAAQLSPGRPSTNCLWRWARKGVNARSGKRVRLQHIRIGGKIFTRLSWVEEFGRELAEADAAHFDRKLASTSTEGGQPVDVDAGRRAREEQVGRELDAAGM